MASGYAALYVDQESKRRDRKAHGHLSLHVPKPDQLMGVAMSSSRRPPSTHKEPATQPNLNADTQVGRIKRLLSLLNSAVRTLLTTPKIYQAAAASQRRLRQ
jgi:hypothetical protein